MVKSGGEDLFEGILLLRFLEEGYMWIYVYNLATLAKLNFFER
jgi:hypothetical protein